MQSNPYPIQNQFNSYLYLISDVIQTQSFYPSNPSYTNSNTTQILSKSNTIPNYIQSSSKPILSQLQFISLLLPIRIEFQSNQIQYNCNSIQGSVLGSVRLNPNWWKIQSKSNLNATKIYVFQTRPNSIVVEIFDLSI